MTPMRTHGTETLGLFLGCCVWMSCGGAEPSPASEPTSIEPAVDEAPAPRAEAQRAESRRGPEEAPDGCEAGDPPAALRHPLDAFEPPGETVVLDGAPTLPLDPPGTAYIRLSTGSIEGGLGSGRGGAAQVRFSSLRPCYEEARSGQPGLTGMMALSFTVDVAGRVDAESIEMAAVQRYGQTYDMGHAGLRACLRSRLLCTRFPEAERPTTMSLQLAFNVEP